MSPPVDASAAEQHFEFDQGDDETLKITREQSDGTALDITNYTFWLTIKRSPRDSDTNAVVQLKVTSHTDPVNGKTEIDLKKADTESLSGSYFYDLQEQTSGGDIQTLLYGRLYFREDITDTTS